MSFQFRENELSMVFEVPAFRPHAMVRGGHLQTLMGVYLPGLDAPYRATSHRVTLPDGDVLVIHEDRPEGWTPQQGTGVLVHGLCGSHLSPYLVRISTKLNQIGIRSIRIDLRGCGAGVGLARNPYHAGRSEDLSAVIESLLAAEPEGAIAVAGFSLGANITLKYLGEQGEAVPEQVVGAVAVNPPIDLSSCIRYLRGPLQVRYDRYFVKLLMQQVKGSPGGLTEELKRQRPRSLYEFDDRYTAPVAGFGRAENYYRVCSSKPLLASIARPSLILMSEDDPLIPASVFADAQLSAEVKLHVAPSGGHLGYLSRGGEDADLRWMDWRVVDGLRRLLHRDQ